MDGERRSIRRSVTGPVWWPRSGRAQPLQQAPDDPLGELHHLGIDPRDLVHDHDTRTLAGAARRLGLGAWLRLGRGEAVTIEVSRVMFDLVGAPFEPGDDPRVPGEPVVGGGVMFRGRAAERAGLETDAPPESPFRWRSLTARS